MPPAGIEPAQPHREAAVRSVQKVEISEIQPQLPRERRQIDVVKNGHDMQPVRNPVVSEHPLLFFPARLVQHEHAPAVQPAA